MCLLLAIGAAILFHPVVSSGHSRTIRPLTAEIQLRDEKRADRVPARFGDDFARRGNVADELARNVFVDIISSARLIEGMSPSETL